MRVVIGDTLPTPYHAVHPSDPAVALVALDVEVVVVGPVGRRMLPLADFCRLPDRDDRTRRADVQ